MSKKSRRRNRKILGALAAGLGAAALMRGRGTPAAANVDSGRGGDSSSAVARAIANAPTGTSYPGANKVANKVVAPVDTTITRTSGIKKSPRVLKDGRGQLIGAQGVDSQGLTRGQRVQRAHLSRMNKVPPSMRGGADAAEGYLRKIPSWGQYPGGWTDKSGGWSSQYKKGGRVKLAKRGLGRAFTKSKK